MSKHTLAPWKANACGTNGRNYASVTGANGSPVASCSYYPRSAEAQQESNANATLIAAAPDLLAALGRCVSYLADLNGSEWIKGDDPGSKDMRAQAKAIQEMAYRAVCKAEGRK